MKKALFSVGLLLGSLSWLTAQTPATAPALAVATPVKVDASAAAEKKDTGAFRRLHESFLTRGKGGPIDLLFLGDSITAGWANAPHIWERYYGRYDPANFGISGDQTQHVIWRIENGELDNLHPKVVVLMLGTNNTGANTADEIFAADKKIIGLIQAKIPGVKVLLLAIFPRGAGKNKQGVINEAGIADAKLRMDVIDAVNAQLATLDNGSTVRYLDIGKVFLGQDGKIPFPIMPDQLHPTPAGYQLWADAMKPLLAEMMK